MRKQEHIITGIYCIENIITNKRYIGQSVDIYSRWSHHRSELNNHTHDNNYLQKSWDKYGEDNFKFYIIEKCLKQELDDKEIYYINQYKTLNRDYGYNLKEGGQSGLISEESNEKRKASLRKYYSSNPEAKKQSSDAAYRQWSNPKIKAKIMGENNGMYGKTHTKEAREKISQAQKGHISHHRNLTSVLCIELNKIYECAVDAAKDLNMQTSNILQVCYGNRKTAGGYHWQFIKENNI